MGNAQRQDTGTDAVTSVSNVEIAQKLDQYAQLLYLEKGASYKAKAYRRAAARIRILSQNLAELVHQDADLTVFPDIGAGISSAVREIVLTGRLTRMESRRADLPESDAELANFPKLDPKRVRRIYKKLEIHSVEQLKQSLATGDIHRALGATMEEHVRQGLATSRSILLYHADVLKDTLEDFLLHACRVRRADVAGDFRRRREVIGEIAFLVETDDFEKVVGTTQRYGGRTPIVQEAPESAVFALPAGVLLKLEHGKPANWGLQLLNLTGSAGHLASLQEEFPRWSHLPSAALASEQDIYAALGLQFIQPELREGRDEVQQAALGALPQLVELRDLRGELHAHSTSSDGAHSIDQMAQAARDAGYEYIGITDHSQSLKIARGLPESDLWEQIRFIDRLNQRLHGIRILKSAEVDILADGTLDYPDALLRELDYTVCSIHSRFALDKAHQTERIMRAMDNKHFHILGHATGRLLLKRAGYEVDMERLVEHAAKNGCFFEINSSPDRLDLSADSARLAASAGVMVAINTDAHSTRDFRLARGGIDQARRAQLRPQDVLNTLPLSALEAKFRR